MKQLEDLGYKYFLQPIKEYVPNELVTIYLRADGDDDHDDENDDFIIDDDDGNNGS